MADITTIFTELPKEIVEKGFELFEKLFGGSLEETGELLKDKIRLRRFKNQLKILAKADDLLKESKLKPKEISLKLLVPLLEYSSLEEEPELQEKWANLIANASVQDDKDLITRNYVEILNRLTANEVKILDYLYNSLLETFNHNKERAKIGGLDIVFSPDTSKFNVKTLYDNFINLEEEQIKYYLDNILSIGLLKWDLSELQKLSEGFKNLSYYGLDGLTSFAMIRNFDPTTNFIFTNLGIGFVKACRFTDEINK